MPHNHQKKAAVINDFSSFGRCSIAVALPILSAMKIQCCPVPTSMFTNHTGFDSYYWTDCTAHMPHYAQEWEKLGLKFDAIATGFLGSVDQIRIVRDFLRRFKGENTIVVVDPVMGDYGQLYPTYSLELAQAMGELVEYADIMTPNLTELCVLTNTPYRDSFSWDELYEMCSRLSSAGPEKVVVSGIVLDENTLGNFVFQRGQEARMLTREKIGPYRSGTGDVFASIITGCAVRGMELLESVEVASDYITKTIRRTVELDIPTTDGICIEEYLTDLA